MRPTDGELQQRMGMSWQAKVDLLEGYDVENTPPEGATLVAATYKAYDAAYLRTRQELLRSARGNPDLTIPNLQQVEIALRSAKRGRYLFIGFSLLKDIEIGYEDAARKGREPSLRIQKLQYIHDAILTDYVSFEMPSMPWEMFDTTPRFMVQDDVRRLKTYPTYYGKS